MVRSEYRTRRRAEVSRGPKHPGVKKSRSDQLAKRSPLATSPLGHGATRGTLRVPVQSNARRASRPMVFVLVALIGVFSYSSPGALDRIAPSDTARSSGFGELPGSYSVTRPPVRFEPNVGQVPSEFEFFLRTSNFLAGINRNAVTFISASELGAGLQGQQPRDGRGVPGTHESRVALKMYFEGGSDSARIIAESPQQVAANYFVGSSPADWRTNVSGYSRIRFVELWKGIDLVMYDDQGQLRYDFELQAHSNPNDISMGFDGARHVEVTREGNLLVSTASGTFSQSPPIAFQDVAGSRETIRSYFAASVSGKVGLRLGTYDDDYPVTIDPVIAYSTYLGGSADDSAASIAVDTAGNTYVTGRTLSTNFPTSSALDSTSNGAYDIFVSKMSPDGSSYVYSTYIGGSGGDEGRDIAVDTAGNAFVIGETKSSDLPTYAPLKSYLSGSMDVFVLKLNSSGTGFVFSTYLGGISDDSGYGIAVDLTGTAVIVGDTFGWSNPETGTFQTNVAGGRDAFVGRISATGSGMLFFSYLGGSTHDYGRGVALDGDGAAYVGGSTYSSDFPVTSAFQETFGGGFGTDGFIAKVDASGSVLAYSSYIGGTSADGVNAIDVDVTGTAFVVGLTASSDFPTESPLQSSKAGGADAFVATIRPEGSALAYSTYLGGANADEAYGVSVDDAGAAHVVGMTGSTDFPTVAPLQEARAGASDMFVTVVASEGTDLEFSTYLGGELVDFGHGVYVDPAGNTHIAGYTSSDSFPVARPLQSARGGSADAFVALLVAPTAAPSDLIARTESASRIQLEWTDNSDNETGFLIERRIGAGMWLELTTVAAGVTTFRDEAIATDTLYTYRVRSTNLGAVSAPSNLAWGGTIASGDTYPTALALSPDKETLYVGHFGFDPDATPTLGVLNSDTGVQLTSIPIGFTFPFGLGVHQGTGMVYASNSALDRVTVLDGESHSVSATIPVEALPRGLAVNSALNRVYVALTIGSSLAVIDTETNTVVSSVWIGGTPAGVAVDESRNRVFVTDESSGNISVIDAESNTLSATISTGMAGLLGIAVDPTRGRAYAASPDTNEIHVIDTNDDQYLTSTATGDEPAVADLDVAANRLYVGLYSGNRTQVFNLSTGVLEREIALGEQPIGHAIDPATDRLFISYHLSGYVRVMER